MKTPVSKNGFIQLSIVARDIGKAALKWGELLGIEPPKIRVDPLEGGANDTYRGEPVSCDLKVADIPMNGFVIELHEPIGGPSSFRGSPDKNGNGVHHIGFEVGEDRDAVIESLKGAGFDTERTLCIYPGSCWPLSTERKTLV